MGFQENRKETTNLEFFLGTLAETVKTNFLATIIFIVSCLSVILYLFYIMEDNSKIG